MSAAPYCRLNDSYSYALLINFLVFLGRGGGEKGSKELGAGVKRLNEREYAGLGKGKFKLENWLKIENQGCIMADHRTIGPRRAWRLAEK